MASSLPLKHTHLSRTSYRAGLLALCLIAFALRLHRLDDLFLSDDEAMSYALYGRQSLMTIFTDYHPNNHWLSSLLGYSLAYLGRPYFLLRWPAVWIGVLAVPGIGAVGYRLFKQRREGLIAALLLCFSAFHWQWSQQFRGYSLLLGCALFSFLFLDHALQTKYRRYWGALLGAIVLTVTSHLFGTLMLIVIVAILAGWSGYSYWRRRESLAQQRWAWTIVVIGLLATGGLIWFGKSQVINLHHTPPQASLRQLLYYQWLALKPTFSEVYDFLESLAVAFTTQRHGGAALAMFWGLSIAGLIFSRRRFPRAFLLLAAWLLIPIIAVILAEFAVAGFFVFDRFLIFILPAWLLLVSRSLTGGAWLAAGPGRWDGQFKFERPAVTFPLILTICLGYLLWLNLNLIQAYFTYRANGDWRGVAAYLAGHAAPTDLILCQQLPHQISPGPAFQDTCLRDLSRRLESAGSQGGASSKNLASLVALDDRFDLDKQAGAVWLVLWGETVPQQASSIGFARYASLQPLPDASTRRTDSPMLMTFDRLRPVALLKTDTHSTLIANLEQTLDYLIRLDTTSPQRFDYALRRARLLAYQGRLIPAPAAFNRAKRLALDRPEAQPHLARTFQFISRFNQPAATPRRQTRIDFGRPAALRLAGHTLPADLQPGQTIPLTFHWQTLAAPEADYTVFLHLRNARGQTVDQLDFRPFDDAYPTSRWPPGSTIAETRFWTLPASLPAGRYTLYLGLYRVETMVRLPLSHRHDGEAAAPLGKVKVDQSPEFFGKER